MIENLKGSWSKLASSPLIKNSSDLLEKWTPSTASASSTCYYQQRPSKPIIKRTKSKIWQDGPSDRRLYCSQHRQITPRVARLKALLPVTISPLKMKWTKLPLPISMVAKTTQPFPIHRSLRSLQYTQIKKLKNNKTTTYIDNHHYEKYINHHCHEEIKQCNVRVNASSGARDI